MKLIPLMVLLLFVSGCGSEPSDSANDELNPSQAESLPKKSQKDAVAAIRKLGGKVWFDDSGKVINVKLHRYDITDADLANFQGLTNLKSLNLRGKELTDAGLVHLRGLTNLRLLYLENTKITEDGVKDLQANLPKCQIKKI